jgi:hypothetical protein
MPVADPTTCPEPIADRADGRYTCGSCGAIKNHTGHHSGDGCSDQDGALCGMPWGRACGKPAVGDGHRWAERDWPFSANGAWRLWWVARAHEPARLVWIIGSLSARWRSTFDVIDLHDGERFEIDGRDMTVGWRAGRAKLTDLPGAMLAAWPRKGARPVPPQFGEAGADAPDLKWLVHHIAGEQPEVQLALALT